jgi:hypothetical protein
MNWSKKDRVLFRILQEFGESDLEAQIQASTRAFLVRKIPPSSVVPFGYYDKTHHEFVWLHGMNRQMERFIAEGYQSLFGEDRSWKKLFHATVPLSPMYQNVIPYLMEIVNARYRVVRLIHKGQEVYALVPLRIKQTFSFDDFSQAMFLYRMDDAMEKKYHRRGTRKQKQSRVQ